MADENQSDNLILRYLRRIDEKLDGVRDDVSEIKTRLGRLVNDVAQVHVALAEHSTRLDRVTMRIERIERRLELTDTP